MGAGAKKARPAQSVKPLTSFQHRLIKEVNFLRLDPIELEAYRSFVFGREITRQEDIVRSRPQRASYTVHGLLEYPASIKVPMKFGDVTRTWILRDEDWLAPRVETIRKICRLGKKFVTRISGNPLWFLHPAARVLVLWPEWPRRSYFAIPVKERLRRVKVFRECSETDRLAQLAYLLNPHNPSTVKVAIVSIAILAKRSASQRRQRDAVEAIQKIHAPELFKRSPAKSQLAKKQGHGSEKAKNLDALTCFAAHMLCTVGKIPPAQAKKLIYYPPDPDHNSAQLAYNSTRQLNAACRRFPKHLQDFRAELMANLVPLGPPLESREMSVSLPDPAQLEAAIPAQQQEPQQGSRADLEAIEQADLDENARKALKDKILEDIAQLDRELKRIGSADDRVVLKNIGRQFKGIIHRISRKGS